MYSIPTGQEYNFKKLSNVEINSRDEPYDFARSDIARRMSEMGEDVANFRDYWQAPPSDMVYFHRKLGGMFLLVARVRARVNVHQLIQRFLP